MKQVLNATVSSLAVAVFLTGSAYASDLGGLKDSPRNDADYTPHAAAFVGLGVGVHGGGQFTNIDILDQFDGIGADGLVGGIHAEYLFAVGGFRVGPYAEGGFSNVNTEIGGTDILNQDSYFGGGIKAGHVFGNALIFGRVGYEWAQWSSDVFSGDIDVDSLVLGGGVDFMIARNVSVGLSADYLVPLNVEAGGTDVTDFVDESESLRVLARVTWRQ